jgi:probable F420-dependent oxidoreductase
MLTSDMAKLDAGGLAVSLFVRDLRDRLDSVVQELEDLGYAAVWLSGGGIDDLDDVRRVVLAGDSITVGSGIIPVIRYDSTAVKELYTELESSAPGRFVLGLGGAHGPNPLATLGSYLDDLDGIVPAERRALAALGPKMLKLARDRTAAAYPYLISAEYVARAREILGPDTSLVVGLLTVFEPDIERARELARNSVAFMGSLPPYAASFRRMGFTEADISTASDRLVDGLAALGGPDEIAARVDELRRAGADQVVLNVNGTDDAVPAWRTLGRRLLS